MRSSGSASERECERQALPAKENRSLGSASEGECDRQALPANENASLRSVVEHHTWSAEASEVLITRQSEHAFSSNDKHRLEAVCFKYFKMIFD